MRKLLTFLILCAWFDGWGQTLGTPTNLLAQIDPANRLELKWKFNSSGLFSVTYPDAKLWFEIQVDNGTLVSITRTQDYTFTMPNNVDYVFTDFYVKPNSSYSFKIKAFFKQSIYSTEQYSSLSSMSNIIVASNVEYGFTVLTHGFQLLGSMGNIKDFEKHTRSIRNRLGGNATILINDGVKGYWTVMNHNGQQMGDLDKTKELIFLFDWSMSSNGGLTLAETGELEMASDRLFSMLTDVKVLNPSTKQVENWYTNAALFAKKNHFIGHSRGVPMLLQVFHRLGKYFPSATIDHFTSLDPHPAPKYGDIVFNDDYAASPQSVSYSLPGIEVFTRPSECGESIGLTAIVETLSSIAKGDLTPVVTNILKPLVYNSFISPICNNAGDIGISLPFNVIKAENYYRQTSNYEQLTYINPRIETIYNAIGNIYSIYELSSFDPNRQNKARVGSSASQIKAVKVKIIMDLESIKAIGQIGRGGFSNSDLLRLDNLFSQLQTVYPGITSMSDLSKIDSYSVFENLINMEVDKAFKLAPFNGIKILDNVQTNDWNIMLNDEIMSSGFSSKYYFKNETVNEALGTMMGGQHSGVHHWYFSTVDPTNRNVGANWFSSLNGLKSTATQLTSGFYYSRIGGHLSSNTFTWPKSTLSSYENSLILRQGKELNPIFNNSFLYGEVGWFGCHYLGSPVLKKLKKFPIFLANTSGFYMYELDGALNTWFYPNLQLKHQSFYLPNNANYLKFKINGTQSTSFKISVGFVIEYGTGAQSILACNDVISFTSGTESSYHCNIPAGIKGKVVALIIDFAYQSSANNEIVKNVYIDDIEITDDNSNSTLLQLNNNDYCRTPYFFGSTALDLKSTWDKALTSKSNSYGFVNWQNRKEFPNWYLETTTDKNFSIYKNSKVTWGEATESIILAANKLGFTEFSQICGTSVSQQELILKHLITNNYCPNRDVSEKIKISELYELIFKIILDKGGVNYPTFTRINTNTTYTGTGNTYVSRAIQTGGAVVLDNKMNAYWLSDGFEEGNISGNENVSRVVLSKTVTLAYEFKKFQLLNSSSSSNGRVIASIDSLPFNDYATIGSRFELEEEEGLFPTVQVDGKTEFLRSGAIINFSFPRDTLTDGTKVHFFWSLNGVMQGINLHPNNSNYQSVQMSVPIVTKEEKFILHIFVGAENGHSAEMYKEIIVRPSGGKNLSKIEYFFDSDPGFGLATQISLNGNNYGIDEVLPINIANHLLNQGIHTLYIRTKDTDNKWSITHTKTFLVLGIGTGSGSQITQVGYFFDSQNAENIANVSVDANNQIALPITVNLTQGIHSISFRVKDSQNKWSLYHTRTFSVLGQGSGGSSGITQVEYFFDADPLEANRIRQNITLDANNQAIIPLNISLSQGIHTVSFRVKDGQEKWSIFHTRTFLVIGSGSGNATISTIEYFMDSDPGLGNGTQVAYATTNNQAVLLNVNVGSLTHGVHVLFVRVKNSLNQWSLTHAKAFVVMPNLGSSSSISRVEYFIDDANPSLGNDISANFIPNPTSSDVLATFDLNISQLSLGIHRIKVRTKDNNNQWSSLVTANFEIIQIPCPQSKTVTENLSNGQLLHQASNTVSLQNTTYNGTVKGEIKAGGSITIGPNTTFDAGTVIKIYVGGCANN